MQNIRQSGTATARLLGRIGPRSTASRAVRVFVSYAREDLAFVDRLAAALRQRGIETFVDRASIEKLALWQQRVAQLIASCDTMVFVISPDSATSPSCRVEIDTALAHNKRLAPVLHREVADDAVPTELGRINYVSCRAGDDFERAVSTLAVALETDIDWIREHTRLAELATRWDAAGQPDDALLHGSQATDALAWIADRPRHAPQPTELHRRFVDASNQTHERRRRAEWSRISGHQQAIDALMRSSDFAGARNELKELLDDLEEATDPEIRSQRSAAEARHRQVASLAEFYECANAVYMRSGEEEFAEAALQCERALNAVRVLDGAQWWETLPTEFLDAEQTLRLRHEAHRQLLLLAGLRMMPGITALTARKRSAIDVAKLLRIVPAAALRGFARVGGLDVLGVLRRSDNAAARACFEACDRVLARVESFEAMHGGADAAAFPRSHTAVMLRRLCNLLAALSSAPAGGRIAYRRIVDHAAHSAATAGEALNPADYYFLGLFNFFIAKRRDAAVAKIVGLFQELFPDLDGRTPFVTAERLLRTGVSREPENFWPHFVLGRTLLEGQDHRGAELAFNVCISIDPAYARGFEQRALALAGQWRQQPHPIVLQRAEEDSRRALALAISDASTWWPRGELMAMLDRPAATLDAWMRWIELEENILARLARGTGLQRAYELTRQILSRPGAARPADLTAHCHALQALVRVVWNEPAEAASSAAQALALVPRHAHAQLVRGLLAHQAGRFAEAIAIYDDVAASDPDIPLARLRRAEALEIAAGYQDALQAWQSVLVAPDSGRVLPAWMRARTEAALARLEAGRGEVT